MNQSNTTKTVPNSFMIAIITHIFISWGYLELTDIATRHLRHNAYLAILLALPFLAPIIWISYDLAVKFQGKPLSYVMETAFGKWAGKIVHLIYTLMLFGLAIHTLWESQLMAGSYFPARIDIRFSIIIIALMTLYLSLHGIKAIGRLAAFLLIIPLVVIYVLQFLGLSNVDSLNVRPLLEGTPRQWFESGLDLFFIFTPASGVLPYLQFFKSPKSLLRVVFISLALVVPLFFLTIFGVIGAYGPAAITKIAWPAIEFFHIIDLPFLLLEQAGLFFIITWHAFLFITLSQAFFIIGNSIHNTFPAFKLKWAIISAAIITTGVVILLPPNIILVKNFLQVNLRYFLGAYYSIILLTWLLARLRLWRSTQIH